MTSQYYHDTEVGSRITGHSYTDFQSGFQLAHPDVAHSTEPNLFDDVPSDLLTEDHLLIRDSATEGDRMMLTALMPVSAAAQRVAMAILRYGWAGSPSREVLGALANVKGYQNVARAVSGLVQAGLINRRDMVSSTRGYSGNMLVFSGVSVCRLLVEQGHPSLSAPAWRVLEHHRLVPGAFDAPPLSDTGPDPGSGPESPPGQDAAADSPFDDETPVDDTLDRGLDFETPGGLIKTETPPPAGGEGPGLDPGGVAGFPDGAGGGPLESGSFQAELNLCEAVAEEGVDVSDGSCLAVARGGLSVETPGRVIRIETLPAFLLYDHYYPGGSSLGFPGRGAGGLNLETPADSLNSETSPGRGPSGSGGGVRPGRGVLRRPCPGCGRRLEAGVVCGCGCGSPVGAGSPEPLSSPVEVYPDGFPAVDSESCLSGSWSDSGDLSSLPLWYQRLAGEVTGRNLPPWRSVHEDQLLCQWSDAVVEEASRRYSAHYAERFVADASALFRKIAVGVVDEFRRGEGRSPPSGRSRGVRRR